MIVLLCCDFFIVSLTDTEPFFEAPRPVQLALAFKHLGELDEECRGLFVLVLQVGPEKIERGFPVLGHLGMALRHFAFQAPFGRIGSRLAAIVQAHPMRGARSLQTGPEAGR